MENNESNTENLNTEEIKQAVAVEAVKSKAMLAEQVDKPARKRGRPAKKDAANPEITPQSLPLSAKIEPIPTAILAPMLKFPFKIAALKTGYEGFSLEDGEADSLAPQLDQVLRTYMPQANSGEMALVVFAASLATVGGMKYMLYLDWKNEQKEKKAQENGVRVENASAI